jgi:hypothetical protein
VVALRLKARSFQEIGRAPETAGADLAHTAIREVLLSATTFIRDLVYQDRR